MAYQFNLHANIADRKVRERADKLRAEMRFDEARNGKSMGPGSHVLTEAYDADLLGEDGRFRPTPNANH